MPLNNSDPPWLTPKPPRRRADKKETSVARRMGARQHAASGSKAEKYDMSTEDLLIEHKYTDQGSFSIKKVYWDDIARHARPRGKEPCMVVEIQGLELAVIKLETLQSLIKESQFLQELQNDTHKTLRIEEM